MALSPPPAPTGGNRKTVAHVLFDKGKISRDQGADIMRRMQGAPGTSVDSVLLEMGISDVDITEAKAEIAGVSFANLLKMTTSDDAKNLVPDDLQARLKVTPLCIEGNTLVVAMENPKDFYALEDLKTRTKMEIRGVLAPPSQIEAFKTGKLSALSNGNGHANGNGAAEKPADAAPAAPEAWDKYDDDMAAILGGIAPVEVVDDPDAKKKKTKKVEVVSEEDAAKAGTDLNPDSVSSDKTVSEEAPIIRIVNTVLLYALKDGASDIHIEPQQKGVRIRYRIDGVLHEQMKIPQYVLNPLISRIKIMSEMNIAERRVPQDGRIKLTMQGKEYDMRVNTCPTVWGEKIVMRVLDKSSVMLGLDKIGLYPDHQEELLDIANQPNGMLYVCGPTGSGKTTTLYSLLNVVSTIEKNVSTVEDPVEYQLPGLTQVQVNRKAGLTFATALRAFLRQDPDVIMVGEIRDLETAEIAVQASLTGHFVLSTIHTNDAPSTATRLGDMGVEPFLISASLTGALAQRLARTICKNCKEEYTPPRETLMRFGFDPLKNQTQKFWHGRGCDACKQTGYKGRTGIYELMRVNEEMQELIVRRSPVTELREAARANGMRTLQEDGFQKCKDGHTTVEEVMRVVFTGGH
ncbi:type IV pilus assembly protein PilB [Abditibacterium utsteinense]|uniref:Type IV pilus assembly protein PilB n=1 Tax=Abditibacterium utsteinense TaxID=1960156 RepID=A0A2S8SVW0_9BACT|nr:type II/IV secretion system protein [Abditibacterium utsteinense]PQV64931.1 type IV pilus assembly protein PilB [Abditibacterium utsteinense]